MVTHRSREGTCLSKVGPNALAREQFTGNAAEDTSAGRIHRQSLIRRAVGFAVALLACSAAAQVQNYPNRPIRAIVPFAPGSPVEIPARLIATRLSEALGQSFIIENRVGAGARVGTALVAKAPPDGYTLLFTNSAHAANVSQYKKLPYDSVADFAPITQVNGTSGNLLVIHPSLPVRSVKELIALAAAARGQLHYATAGVGSPQHVAGALFAAMAHIELMHVPYKGTIAGLTDVIGGRAEIMFVSPGVALPFVKEGRVRTIGVTGPQRLPALSDVPTIHEAGVPGYEFTSWHGMWFPAGVPREIVRRMHAEVLKVLAVPEVRKQFDEQFLTPVGSSPEEFAAFVKKDIAVQAGIVKMIGLEPE